MTTPSNPDALAEALRVLAEPLLVPHLAQITGFSTEQTDPQPAQALLALAETLAATRAPDEVLTRGGARYLERWWLRTRDEGSPRRYLHRIGADDADDPHDHPWPSASLMLRGVLREEHWDDGPSASDGTPPRTRTLRAGERVLRRLGHVHRLKVEEGPVLTLFFTGGKTRPWGFWTEHGFVRHDRYVEARPAPRPVVGHAHPAPAA